MVKLSRTILVFFTLAGFATTLGAAAADFAAGFAIAFFAGTVFAGAAFGAAATGVAGAEIGFAALVGADFAVVDMVVL
jgi:hypothetical protein